MDAKDKKEFRSHLQKHLSEWRDECPFTIEISNMNEYRDNQDYQ